MAAKLFFVIMTAALASLVMAMYADGMAYTYIAEGLATIAAVVNWFSE